MTPPIRVAVLGGGSWGTTVASLAAANTPTVLWARSEETAREIHEQHTNSRFLDDRELESSLEATSDLEEAVTKADVLVVGVPSQAIRETLEQVAPHLRPWVPVLSLAKGLEQGTRMRPTEIVGEVLPGHPVGLMAGPNLAKEVLDGMAAAAVVAMADARVAESLQALFHSPRFRVYRNDDLLGSELGGVLKNVIAIAAGMAEGLGVGDNTRAMVLTRGLEEMTRLGEAMGGQPRTFAGLTGLGDLMATCMSPQSRNRRVGEELAKDKSLEQIAEEMQQVAEGVKTARTVMELAEEHEVTLPICCEVDLVVNEGRHPRDAYAGLQHERAKSEQHQVA